MMGRGVKDPEPRSYRQGEAVLTTFRGWCKGCDLCIASCPVGILSLAEDDRIEVSDISRCVFCGICQLRCPDFVFTLQRPERDEARHMHVEGSWTS